MVIAKLQGGLGNQMFQYATARSITREHESVIVDPVFFTNLHQIAGITPRNLDIQIFKGLKARIASPLFQQLLHHPGFCFRGARKFFLRNLTFVSQIGNEFIASLAEIAGHVYLDGYFQSEKYFLKIRTQLLNELAFPELDPANQQQVKQIDSKPQSIALHVRRGDYLKPEVKKFHGILPIDYYTTAIELLNSQLSDPHYFIFSDDMKWCQANFDFLQNKSTFMSVDNAKEGWKDMSLMTSCRHHIIANSSFSWWGAWLSQKEGINIAPSKWFNPEVTRFNINDFVPSSWKIIDHA